MHTEQGLGIVSPMAREEWLRDVQQAMGTILMTDSSVIKNGGLHIVKVPQMKIHYFECEN